MKERKNRRRFRLAVRIAALALTALVFAAGMPGMAFADGDFSHVASSGEMAKADSVTKYGMVPVYGRDIADGTYEMKVKSSSGFFRVDHADLTVADGEMTAVLYLDSYAYSYLYMGTGEEAATKTEADFVPDVENNEGWSTFTVKVEALDKALDCAAFSIKKNQWYNRKICFEASSLPADALDFTLPDYDAIEAAMEKAGTGTEAAETKTATDSGTVQGGANGSDAYTPVEPMEISVSDGEYSIEVNMTGGSGRASVSSPTYLIVKDGRAYAHLIWSSTYYDYMIVGGVKYPNESTDGGNSTFTIPIAAMDTILPVIADTTAMGDPVEIEYSLTFYQQTIAERGMIPQEAAKKVILIALVVIAAGAVINALVKRRWYQ